jgi:hypothetical protein
MWLWIVTLQTLSLILVDEPHKNINNIFILIFAHPENIIVGPNTVVFSLKIRSIQRIMLKV